MDRLKRVSSERTAPQIAAIEGLCSRGEARSRDGTDGDGLPNPVVGRRSFEDVVLDVGNRPDLDPSVP